MDINSILFILALLVLVALYVGQPFADKRSIEVSATEQEISTLLAERDRVLEALTELDFDHSMDKVPEEIYPSQRARLVEQGAETLRQLDMYYQDSHKLQTELGPGEISEDELEALIADRKHLKNKNSATFCHSCGSPLQSGDKFCSNCGETIS